jgi:hypothetical protein
MTSVQRRFSTAEIRDVYQGGWAGIIAAFGRVAATTAAE